MKTFACIASTVAGTLLLAWVFGVVGFHFPHVVDDEPLQNPTEVIGVVDNRLYLSDLRVIHLRTGSHERLVETLAQSDYQIDIQGT